MPNITLRPYQEEGVKEIRAAFAAKQSPVLFVLPTGGGKTYTFSYIGSKAADLSNDVWIIVHRKELLLQASKSLRNLGIEHGMISPHFTPSPHKLVQVASVDTLMSRLQKGTLLAQRFRLPKLVIFDEAHHVTAANKWGRVWQMLGSPRMLGVTATPVRGDGVGLGEGHGGVFKTMVIGPLVAELIEIGMLINPEVYTCLQPPDLSGLKTNKEGEYNMKEVEERVDRPMITGSAVEHYKEICPGARTIVFCTSIKHARHVVEQFNAAGFRFALLVGEPEMSDAERTEVNRKLAAGELDGACTVDLVSEGYDLPDLTCCIMLRPTASESLYLQQVGRVMRPSPGKTTCYLLDHVGNIGRQVDGKWKTKHGLPDQIREWSLEGKKKGKRKAKDEEEEKDTLYQCQTCWHIFDLVPPNGGAHLTECPKCQAAIEKKAGGRKLEEVDGKLYKVDALMEAQIKQEKRAAQAGAKTVEDLMNQLGYSRRRAEEVVKAREEKAELRDTLIADLRAWHAETGQTVLQLFHIHMADVRSMKPKALKDLRAQFDAHRDRYHEKHGAPAPQQEQLFNNADQAAAQFLEEQY